MQRTINQKIGSLGEEIACRFLIKSGYVITSRNLKVDSLEVDIIAEKSSELTIFEIKCVAREMIEKADISREMFNAASHYGLQKATNIHLAAEKLGIGSVYLLAVALSLMDGKAYVVAYEA